MTRYRLTAALLSGLALTACEKTAVQNITVPELPASSVRFFNFGVNAPAVNFYANTTKMSAISSALCSPTPTDTVAQRVCRETGQESTAGVTNTSAAAGGLYSAIAPGNYTLKGTIAATVDKNLAVASLDATLEPNKAYSYYISGFYNTTAKTVESFIVEDPIPAIDWSMVTIRFVNASSNSNPMTLTARDSTTKTETAVATAVAYKSAGAFMKIPAGLYELYTTAAGSGTKVIQRTGVTLVAGRIYTISARGDITAAGRFLDNTANR